MSAEHVSKTKRISCVAPSTRGSVQFLAVLYIHALALVILVVFRETCSPQPSVASSYHWFVNKFIQFVRNGQEILEKPKRGQN